MDDSTSPSPSTTQRSGRSLAAAVAAAFPAVAVLAAVFSPVGGVVVEAVVVSFSGNVDGILDEVVRCAVGVVAAAVIWLVLPDVGGRRRS